MSVVNLCVLFFACCTFLIGLLILFKRNDSVSKNFFTFCFSVAAWGIFFSFLVSARSADSALILARFTNVAALFIPPSCLYFVFDFIGIKERRKKITTCVYGLSCFIACFGFTPLYIPYAKRVFDAFYYPQPGLLYHVFTGEFFLVVAYGFVELLRNVRFQSGSQRTQTNALILATFLGFFGGSFTFLPVYDLMIRQEGVVFMTLYPFIMAYAMIKHGLLDKEEILAIHRDKLALIGLMSSSINHEIKNPLFLMQEFARKALHIQSTDRNPEETVEILGKMSDQIARMQKLVERISEFGKPNPHPGVDEDVDIAQVMEDALYFASQELKYRSVELKLNLEPDLPKLKGDKSQFEEIFLNLIVNAYHAMPKGGTLTISAREIRGEGRGMRDGRPLAVSRCETNRPGFLTGHGTPPAVSILETKRWGFATNNVQITIADTGIGIPKNDLKDIFKPFFTTKQKSGTGLGLHIVKTLVEQNKGKIAVESDVGKGTAFRICFPSSD